MQPIPALQNPYEAHRPRLKRQVLSFEKALETLKLAKNGSVRCAAFHSYGRCPKEIPLNHSDFLVHLDQSRIADIGSVVKVMPLMLCPTHWEKTVYYNALILDYLSFTGSKLNTQDYENIVIDLESAKVIKEEESSSLEISVPLNASTRDQATQGSATSSPIRGESFLNGNDIRIHVSPVKTEFPIRSTLTASSTQNSHTTIGLGDNKGFQTQDGPMGDGQLAHSISADEQADEDFLGPATLANVNSYASLELGVAKLEIMYQKSLKCISMAPDGWRCKELIKTERLLEAQRLSSALGDSQQELKTLAELVLCTGHACGKLPQLYSEKWSAFAAKRLPKGEAMSRFDPEQWSSVLFFGARNSPPAELRKTRSTSDLPQTQFESAYYFSLDREEVDSKLSPPAKKISIRKQFNFVPATPSLESKFTMPTSPASAPSKNSSIIPQVAANSIVTTPGISVSIPPPTPALAADYVGTSGDFDDAENNNPTVSVAHTAKRSLIFDRSASPTLSTRVEILVPPTISPTGRIFVRMPPTTPLGPSSDVSNLSSDFAEVRLSGEASNYNCPSSVNDADTDDAVLSEVTMSDQTAILGHRSAPSTFQRVLKQPVSIVYQSVIDGHIIDEILSSIPRGGYVYIFKSVDRNLVKIGKATDVARRINQIRTECQIDDLNEVESGSYRVKYPERVERLVHLELRNFRVKFMCQHLRGSGSQETEQEHREWFDVPEDVAVQSVKRWRDFVEMAYTPEGTIKEHWAKMTTLIPKPSGLEQRYLTTGLDEGNGVDLTKHHQLRHERYQDWTKYSQS